MSQNAAAEYIGVSSSTMSYWLRGKRYPDRGSVLRLAGFFKVDESEISAKVPASLPQTDNLSAVAASIQRMARITEWMVERNVTAEQADAILERLYQELRQGA